MTKSPAEIRSFFTAIATQYDTVNSLMSFGSHHYWNHSLIREILAHTSTAPNPNMHLLDLCAGTGAIAFKYLSKHPQATATLVDFCPEMLAVAEKRSYPIARNRFFLVESDATQLPFPSASFPIASIAYGLRNIKDRQACLQEVYRVLIPGGYFYILELTKPEKNRWLRTAHKLLLRGYIPLVGRIFTKNAQAYQHLRDSINNLPEVAAISQMLVKENFSVNKVRSLTFGSATLWVAKKPC